MARRLSDIEWTTFLHEVNVAELELPPWGGVVEWGGMPVLVFIAANNEVWLTDLTSNPELLANIPRIYDAHAGVWIYHLPEELMNRTVVVAGQALTGTQYIIDKAAQIIGGAAGGLTKPLLDNLMVPLAIAGIGLGVIYVLPMLRRSA